MSIWTRIAETLGTIGDSIGGFLQRVSAARVTPPEKTVAFTIGMIALGPRHQSLPDAILGTAAINRPR